MVREVNGALSVIGMTEVRWISVVPRVVFSGNLPQPDLSPDHLNLDSDPLNPYHVVEFKALDASNLLLIKDLSSSGGSFYEQDYWN
jgi:hypothetical protein